eukprot:TRINITY_DN257_c0_g1_i1.p1 TRINITY_DN257_c0_g1~~TRINITY_DN257_c0_g1_i1.p1  ORF type:complete len:221 (+),score=46.12 TRINITY_DN257_c0_g1_i1:86-748(+)
MASFYELFLGSRKEKVRTKGAMQVTLVRGQEKSTFVIREKDGPFSLAEEIRNQLLGVYEQDTGDGFMNQNSDERNNNSTRQLSRSLVNEQSYSFQRIYIHSTPPFDFYLNKFPTDVLVLSSQLQKLSLVRHHITSIPCSSWIGDSLSQILSLKITHSKLKYVPVDLLFTRLTTLRSIDLSANEIQTLPLGHYFRILSSHFQLLQNFDRSHLFRPFLFSSL